MNWRGLALVAVVVSVVVAVIGANERIDGRMTLTAAADRLREGMDDAPHQ